MGESETGGTVSSGVLPSPGFSLRPGRFWGGGAFSGGAAGSSALGTGGGAAAGSEGRKSVPQLLQKLEPARLAVPQWGQRMIDMDRAKSAA
jgi:hypothetical protein